jgi:drug/metabolite transporter (DMT)-like permease
MKTATHFGQGIALMLAALTCFAAMDTTVRFLGATVPVLVLLILRYLTQAVLMVPVLLVTGHGFRSARPGFQLLRGLLLLACSAITFIGLRYMPVAEYTAIAMLTPVLVALFSVLLFKEKVSAVRWALIAGALAGALVVIRPGSGIFGWVVLWPLAGSCAYAAFQLLTSRYAALENAFVTHFWTGAVGALAVLPAWAAGFADVPGTWQALPAQGQVLVAVVGLLGTVGHLLLILAFGRAPASRLTPFLYLQIAIAVLMGWAALGDVPDGWAWVGMAVIAACGAATAVLNMRAASRARRELSAVEADTTAD